MSDDGLFVQWVQLYDISLDLVLSVLKAIAENFEDYVVYTITNGDMMIVAKRKGTVPQPDYSAMKLPVIGAALRKIDIGSEQDISIRKIGTKRFFERLLKASVVPANSDYSPFLDQNAERARFLGSTAKEFSLFTHLPLPALEMLTSSPARTGFPRMFCIRSIRKKA